MVVLCDFYFVFIKRVKLNLMVEGVKEEIIFVIGNIVIDIFKFIVKEDYVFKEDSLINIDFLKRIIFFIVYRRENFGKLFENIFEVVLKIVNEFEDVVFVYFVYLNLNVKDVVYRILKDYLRIKFINLIDVDDMYNFIVRSYLVLIDFGGFQEEVLLLGKFVVVLCDIIERFEVVLVKMVVVVGISKERIVEIVIKFLIDEEEYFQMVRVVNFYGDGEVLRRIKDVFLYYFGESSKKLNEFCGSDKYV